MPECYHGPRAHPQRSCLRAGPFVSLPRGIEPRSVIQSPAGRGGMAIKNYTDFGRPLEVKTKTKSALQASGVGESEGPRVALLGVLPGHELGAGPR